MVIFGDGLVPTTPLGPTQDVAGRLPHGQDQPPPQAPNLGDAQWDTRPRLALNAVSGLSG
jgi:hypothetical protein